MYYVNESHCVGCGACTKNCPQGAINLLNDKAHINQELCTECGVCQEICPNGAIIELEMTENGVQPGWETPPLRVKQKRINKNISVSSSKQTKIFSAITAIAPVVLDVIYTFIQNRALKGGKLTEKQCKGRGRGFGRRGQGRCGKRWKRPF